MCELITSIQEVLTRGPVEKTSLAEIQNLVSEAIPNLQLELCGQDWEPGRYMLYKDQRHGFVVMMLVWGKGDKTPIHAHGTWGVEAVIKNQVCVTNFTYCNISPKETKSEILDAGAVTYVIPPDEDVHVVAQSGELPAITVHVYGKELTENIVFSAGHGFRPCPVTCRKVSTDFFNFGSWPQMAGFSLSGPIIRV
ncbi:MAG: cysteine dioxygenase family protein [Proteobacteria bacterium]|nr:cysteine dioxygenase family protein [Pseudomonadota bacterium]